MIAERMGQGAQAGKPRTFRDFKPAPEPPLMDPFQRLQGAREVTKEEAREASRKAADAESCGMHCPDGVVSVVVVNPVPSDFDLDCRPVRVPVGGFREEALAYFMEREK